jgi:hypothetical protein
MWCRSCHKEIDADTAELAGMACPSCNRPLSTNPRHTDSIRHAREILERWQSTDLFEQISSTSPLTALKKQDRAPLLNIPLGQRSTPLIPPGPAISQAQSIPAVPTDVDPQVLMSKTAQNLNANFWESLIAPPPLLAATAPPLNPTESAQTLEVPANGAEASEEVVAESIIKAIADAVETEPPPIPLSKPLTTKPSPSSQSTQTSPPALMSSAAIREEPETAARESAETAKQIKQDNAATTKKSERPVLRRPPLNRRAQFERTVSASSAGSIAVTRNLRIDQPGGAPELPPAGEADAQLTSSVAPETKIVSNSPKPGRRFRIDTAEPIEAIAETDGRRMRTQGLPKHRYIDESHESALRGPHFEISTPRRTNLTSITGQFLAYLGVLGLTIGTAMVIYGHFGGYSEYTPTGWLVTTVAQMLLFLGVINLVSGGIEQNNEDVSRRMNSMGEQLLRIEQVTSEALRGPKLSPRLYADPDAIVEESTRETIASERD